MIRLGMAADDVRKNYGRPIATRVDGEEPELAREVALPGGEKVTVAALIVQWWYPTFGVEFRYRGEDSVYAYRVQKVLRDRSRGLDDTGVE